MGTRKTAVRTFEDSLGLDLTSSNLTRDPSASIEFKNIERLFDGSYRGREGAKLLAQPLYTLGYHRYIYEDENGENQEELLCVGVRAPETTEVTWPLSASTIQENGPILYKLAEENFTISYSGSDPWDIEVAFDCETNTLHAKIIEDGVTLLDKNLGLGTESSPVTLKDLADDIDALSDFSCFPSQSAIINGAYSGANPTVDSGHTLAKGDWVWTSNRQAEVTATGSTSLNLRRSLIYLDNEVIGHALFPAAILSLQKQLNTATSSKTVTYHYWKPVACLSTEYRDVPGLQKYPLGLFPFKDEVGLKRYGENYSSQRQGLVSFTTHNNCVYLSSDFASEVELKKYVGNFTAAAIQSVVTTNYHAGVWKYDGKDLCLSGPVSFYGGVRSVSTPFTYLIYSQTGASGLADGNYISQLSLLRKDFQRNIIESFLEYQYSFTVSGGPKTFKIQFRNTFLTDASCFPHRQFDMRYTTATATVSVASTTFSVTADHTIRTGDTVFFINNSGLFEERKVVDWTRTTIVLDTTATIANGSYISIYCWRMWRTKASGAEFFLAAQYPLFPGGGQTLVDATADADLGVNINSVKQTSLQYTFPRVKSLGVHQGLLAGAGGREPNSILWEDPLYLESLDYARNAVPLATDSSPQINQILSTAASSILAIKENDVHESVGGLADASVETTPVLKNTFGGSGSSTSVQIKRDILSLCKLGLSVIPSSSPDNVVPDKSLLSVFRDCACLGVPGIVVERAIIYWDSIKNWVHIVLPFEDIEDDSGGTSGQIYYIPTDSTRYFVLQLPQLPDQPVLMSEFTFSQGVKMLPTAGFSEYDASLVFGSRYFDQDDGVLKGFTYMRMDKMRNGTKQDRFSDNGASYDWSYVPQWDDGDTPEYEKVWHEFELYQLQPENFVASFDINFESFRDWVLDNTKRDTQRTLSFSASTTTANKIQFDPGYKAKRRTFRLSGTVCKNPPLFTGYSYTVDDVERRKDKFGR